MGLMRTVSMYAEVALFIHIVTLMRGSLDLLAWFSQLTRACQITNR
jgi:hypothetical protein